MYISSRRSEEVTLNFRNSVDNTFLYSIFVMLPLAWILVIVAISGANAATQNDGDVDITQHPYVVSIKKNGKHVCSGAIIDEYHIVTSDRCVPSFKHIWNTGMNNIFVVSGTSSLKPGGVETFVKEMFSQNHHVNPLENKVTSGLGVIKLARPLQFNEKVQPIALSETEVPLGAKLQMVGWMIADHEKITANLKQVTLTTIDSEKCQSFHEKDLSESEFCTLAESESNYCKGDSGSPLIYKGKLVGLTTYSISCIETPVPDVHTSISKNIDYLKEIMES